MGEIMRTMHFPSIMRWALREYDESGSIFGISKESFYKNSTGNYITIFGDRLASPVGPAAGPNSQLAQNIIAAYLCGSRFIELKTVQKMDGGELRKCVARPCINAEDECYNVEWSTELYVHEAFDEYVKAWIGVQVIARELGIADSRDFAFNMSVGYDLEGIKSNKIDSYIEGMKNASETPVWKECIGWLKDNASLFKNISGFIDAIGPEICSSITLSTLHGCPPEEIEKIASYLLTEKKTHTFIKCNPTLLGYETTRKILDSMGYGYVSFDERHFKNDMQYPDAVHMLRRLIALAKSVGLEFGVKITNTFPVQIRNNELPGNEMYMSGRSLFPLSITVANKLAQEFCGTLPISFSGGADFFNIGDIFETGIRPITIATTILKPGGYERIRQLAQRLEPLMEGCSGCGRVPERLAGLAVRAYSLPRHQKNARTVKSRKTSSRLPVFDCFKAPCKDGGCPINQQIPEYLELVAAGKYDEAFEVIAIDNACPSVTGEICSHACQMKCTRLDYEDSLRIRASKAIAAAAAQEKYISHIKPPPLKTDKKAVIIGAGPGGIATALYLRRNGVSATVLEKRDKPFGIVEYVIPEFRIPAKALRMDFKMAVKHGVEFKFGVYEEYDVASLKKEYDYIVIATGAWREGASPVIEGQDKIYGALAFLQDSKKNGLNITLGKTVAVVGGGDVAMDCARAAKRAPGVEKSAIVYRRTKEFMPAGHEEIELALADGVELMELIAPVSYDGRSLKCEVTRLGDMDETGRRGVIGTGEIKTLEFDTVIGAVGARVCTRLIEKNGINVDGRGRVQVDESCRTNIENVFVAGDCRGEPSTIVAAMSDGKKIAKAILSELGLPDDFRAYATKYSHSGLYAKKGILKAASKDNIDGLRCLGCGEICEICCGVCPNRANVAISVPGFRDIHQILHIDGMCNECGNCGVFCPYNGNPYKDKITLFWTEEDFADSTNKGFLRLFDGRFRLRLENGDVAEYEPDSVKMPREFRAVIEKVLDEHSYLFAL